MKNLIFLVIISLTATYNYSIAQQGLPSPPKSNSQADAEKYEQEKKEWIKNNPEKYAKLNGKTQSENSIKEIKNPSIFKNPSDDQEISKKELNQIKYPKSQDDNTLYNPYKDLQIANDNVTTPSKDDSFLFFTGDSTSIPATEYLKHNTPIENIHQKTNQFIIPKDKEIWSYFSLDVYSKKGKAEEKEVNNIKTEIQNKITNDLQLFAIEKKQIIVIEEENFFIIAQDISPNDISTTQEACDDCVLQKFTIDNKHSSDDLFVVELTYDIELEIIIRLYFKKVMRP